MVTLWVLAFGGVGLPTYKWTYSTTDLQHRQTWVDSSGNNDATHRATATSPAEHRPADPG